MTRKFESLLHVITNNKCLIFALVPTLDNHRWYGSVIEIDWANERVRVAFTYPDKDFTTNRVFANWSFHDIVVPLNLEEIPESVIRYFDKKYPDRVDLIKPIQLEDLL